MLLGILIEQITGENLDDYLEGTIYRSLDLKNTLYNPALSVG
jgi:CubicO group peptidase (beta-lactamase class C family)